MFIFKKLKDKDNRFDTNDVIMRSEAMTIPEIMEDFRDFLKGCGYRFKDESEYGGDENINYSSQEEEEEVSLMDSIDPKTLTEDY